MIREKQLKIKSDYIVLLLNLLLTQEEAADLIGCSRVTLNRQINGHIDRDWIKKKLLSITLTMKQLNI